MVPVVDRTFFQFGSKLVQWIEPKENRSISKWTDRTQSEQIELKVRSYELRSSSLYTKWSSNQNQTQKDTSIQKCSARVSQISLWQIRGLACRNGAKAWRYWFPNWYSVTSCGRRVFMQSTILMRQQVRPFCRILLMVHWLVEYANHIVPLTLCGGCFLASPKPENVHHIFGKSFLKTLEKSVRLKIYKRKRRKYFSAAENVALFRQLKMCTENVHCHTKI